MFKFIKKLIHITKNYDSDILKQKEEMLRILNKVTWNEKTCITAKNLIRDRTEIDADIHFHGNNRNQIITIGRYRKRDYVQVFTTNNNDFSCLIDQLRNMQKYGVVEKVDIIPSMRFIIDRELE